MGVRVAVTSSIDALRASYWFVPTCLVIGAIILSIVTLRIDDAYAIPDFAEIIPLIDARTAGAQAVLSTIAGSVMGVAGVTFSVTMVAVSFASTNYGPRLIGNFMRDRGNQITLGVFIGTFVYALMVLRTVHEGGDGVDAFVPHLSVLTAVSLALISVGFLIYFIHHVPETINVSNIAAQLGRELETGITGMFDSGTSHDESQNATRAAVDWTGDVEAKDAQQIRSNRSGYVRALDYADIVELAQDHRLKVIIEVLPGDFVTKSDTFYSVWADAPLDDNLKDTLCGTFSIGDARTKHQDIAFAAEQLVEVIARALSPGINDPFTAITCINWLRSGLESFTLSGKFAEQPFESDRVWSKPQSFTRMLTLVCDGVRQYVAENATVTLHLLQSLGTLAERLPPGPRLDAVVDEITKLHETARDCLVDGSQSKEIDAYVAGLLNDLATVGRPTSET